MRIRHLDAEYFAIFLFAVVVLIFSAPSISYAQQCQVGDVLSSGQSCIDGATGDRFSVLSNGNGRYLFITAGTAINLSGNINDQNRNFSAENRGDGNWEILSATPDGTQPPPEFQLNRKLNKRSVI